MTSLFIDTSLSTTTLAIILDDKILSKSVELNDNTLSDRVFTYIENCFMNSNKQVKDIDRIFLVNGPGSFTGTRVGVTIAKVMAWSLKVPVATLSSLEFLATTKVDTDYIISYIDARRGYVYAGIYDRNLNEVSQNKYIHLDDLIKTIPTDGTVSWISYEKIDNIDNILPDCDILKIIDRHRNDNEVNIHSLVPNYLKQTEAEEKLKDCEIHI